MGLAHRPTLELKARERGLRAVPRILVVDDERALGDLTAELLRDEGYAVQCAYSGEKALALLRSGPPPDLVLSDVMMPGLDGVQLVTLTRTTLGLTDLPFLLLSATTVPRLRWQHVGFMPKPLDVDELLARVRQLLHRRSTRRA